MWNKLQQTKRSKERKTTQKFESSCVLTWFVSGYFPHLGIVFSCLFLADLMWLKMFSMLLSQQLNLMFVMLIKGICWFKSCFSVMSGSDFMISVLTQKKEFIRCDSYLFNPVQWITMDDNRSRGNDTMMPVLSGWTVNHVHLHSCSWMFVCSSSSLMTSLTLFHVVILGWIKARMNDSVTSLSDTVTTWEETKMVLFELICLICLFIFVT